MVYENYLKEYLDFLYEKYCVPAFVPNDPISFPYRYKNQNDIETIAFVTSWVSIGRRTKILVSAEIICQFLGSSPFEKIANLNEKQAFEELKDFNHFAYSNVRGKTIVVLLFWTKQILEKYGTLKNSFLFHFNNSENLKEAQKSWINEFYACKLPESISEIERITKIILPNTSKGSACKRTQMFLRWLVRKDKVDLGIWNEIPASELIIPLDTHVSTISRMLKLTSRKQDDWKTAVEITNKLKTFSPNDPIKYDFALFGAGISKEKPFNKFLQEMNEKGLI
ncbi:TIGR02757 family protein [bacterium]|nr:TIGR02757 family protein [bacterium]